ncbi:hypothetical protein D3C80_743330 [compost metagenome]
MGELGAGLGGSFCNRARPGVLDRIKRVATALEQNADAVDHMVRAFHGAVNGLAIAKIGLDQRNLADISGRQEETREIRAAHRDAHAIAAFYQRPDHMATYETRSSENGNERRKIVHGHGLPRKLSLTHWSLA